MNIFDLIGTVVVNVIKSITTVINLITVSVKKKVLTTLEPKPNRQQIQELKAELARLTKPSKPTKTEDSASNLFSPQNPVPGVDLLQKEGWSRVHVHPVPETGQQVLILKNEKENKAKMLGKQAFLDYLEELNKKHGRR